ncbi:TetR/AcrR family transcriptional regulator C-terminal domain-containing protein [Streptomyces sp. NPDC002104]
MRGARSSPAFNIFSDLGTEWYERGFQRGLATLAETFRRLAGQGLLRIEDPFLAANHFSGLLLWIAYNPCAVSWVLLVQRLVRCVVLCLRGRTVRASSPFHPAGGSVRRHRHRSRRHARRGRARRR